MTIKKNNKINCIWIRRSFCTTQDNVQKRQEVIKKTKSECRDRLQMALGRKQIADKKHLLQFTAQTSSFPVRETAFSRLFSEA